MQTGYNFRLPPFNVYLFPTIQQELTSRTDRNLIWNTRPKQIHVLQDSCGQLFAGVLNFYKLAPPQGWSGLSAHQVHRERKAEKVTFLHCHSISIPLQNSVWAKRTTGYYFRMRTVCQQSSPARVFRKRGEERKKTHTKELKLIF